MNSLGRVDGLQSLAKVKAARWVLAVNSILTLIKLAAALATGSVGLLSETVHSLADSAGASLAWLGVKKAEEPADAGHPYGHARIETVVGLAEAAILGVVAIFVFGHSAMHLISHTKVKTPDIGFAVSIVCACISLVSGLFVGKIAKDMKSIALRVSSVDFLSDFYTSLAIALGLAGVWAWNLQWLDGVLGILVSVWLIKNAVMMGREAFEELIDRALPDEPLAKVVSIVKGTSGVISYHRLRSRISGRTAIIDLHVVVPNEWTVTQAHAVADSIEKKIKVELDPAIVIVHVDPFDPNKASKPAPPIKP